MHSSYFQELMMIKVLP